MAIDQSKQQLTLHPPPQRGAPPIVCIVKVGNANRDAGASAECQDDSRTKQDM
jgi:hypothetical protein